MALSASTAAERKELVEAANNLLKACKDFDNSGFLETTNTALMAQYQAAITRMSAAITAATN